MLIPPRCRNAAADRKKAGDREQRDGQQASVRVLGISSVGDYFVGDDSIQSRPVIQGHSARAMQKTCFEPSVAWALEMYQGQEEVENGHASQHT